MNAEAARLYIVAATVATEVPPDAPEAEFKGVIDVMRNRVRVFRKSLLQVVLAPRQFSAVCREQYWRDALDGVWLPAHVARCYQLLEQDWPDTTGGATHYYSPIGMVPRGSVPAWAGSMTEMDVPGVRPNYFRFFKGSTEDV